MFRNRLLQYIELQANYLQVSISWYSHVNAVKDTFKFCLQEDETAWSSRHPERWSSKVQNGVWLLENQKCETDSETCFFWAYVCTYCFGFTCLFACRSPETHWMDEVFLPVDPLWFPWFEGIMSSMTDNKHWNSIWVVTQFWPIQ